MKKISLFYLLFFTTLVTYAQEKDSIDFGSEIKKVVIDPMSQYYYPLLLEKVKNNPMDINEMDCYYLYYGQIYQPDYKALSFFANPERMAFDRASMNGNCKKSIPLGKIMLEKNPVELTVLLHTSICIDKRKKYVDTDYLPQRYNNLLSAIFSTGDGKTKETAIKIVNIEDEYILKGTLGFFGGEETLMSDANHYYSVWSKNGMNLYLEHIMNVKLPTINKEE